MSSPNLSTCTNGMPAKYSVPHKSIWSHKAKPQFVGSMLEHHPSMEADWRSLGPRIQIRITKGSIFRVHRRLCFQLLNNMFLFVVYVLLVLKGCCHYWLSRKLKQMEVWVACAFFCRGFAGALALMGMNLDPEMVGPIGLPRHERSLGCGFCKPMASPYQKVVDLAGILEQPFLNQPAKGTPPKNIKPDRSLFKRTWSKPGPLLLRQAPCELLGGYRTSICLICFPLLVLKGIDFTTRNSFSFRGEKGKWTYQEH